MRTSSLNFSLVWGTSDTQLDAESKPAFKIHLRILIMLTSWQGIPYYSEGEMKAHNHFENLTEQLTYVELVLW